MSIQYIHKIVLKQFSAIEKKIQKTQEINLKKYCRKTLKSDQFYRSTQRII